MSRRKILRRPGKVKHWWYKRGHRPKPGTLLYSPSLALLHGYWSAEVTRGLCKCQCSHEGPGHAPYCPLSDDPAHAR